MTFVYLDPTEAPVSPSRQAAQRPNHYKDCVLGILDNGKTNSNKFLSYIATMLRSRLQLKEVLTFRKPSPYRTAPADLLQDMAARCHLLITGIGD